MKNTTRVVPAILTDDAAALSDMAEQAEKFTNYLQIDIMDGAFVPSKSITAKQIAALSLKAAWEAHIMVKNPQDYLEDFKKAGAKRVIFHFEATKQLPEAFDIANTLKLPVGLAINPDTRVESVIPYVDKMDCLLFLSVNPGFYGSPFIPEVLKKIKKFRSLHPDMETGIDGGIKESNIAEVAQTGVDYICVGSAVFMQDDPAASYRRLSELAAKASA